MLVKCIDCISYRSRPPTSVWQYIYRGLVRQSLPPCAFLLIVLSQTTFLSLVSSLQVIEKSCFRCICHPDLIESSGAISFDHLQLWIYKIFQHPKLKSASFNIYSSKVYVNCNLSNVIKVCYLRSRAHCDNVEEV